MSDNNSRKALSRARKARRKRAQNNTPLNARLEQLRNVIHAEPMPFRWTQVCKQMDAWPDDETLHMAIDYIDAHLDAQWPDAMRVSKGVAYRWIAQRFKGYPEPRVRLLRTVHIKDEHAQYSERFAELLEEGLLNAITSLEVHNPDGIDVLAQHLSTRPSVTLRHLRMPGGSLSHHMLQTLFEGDRFTQLRTLDLRGHHGCHVLFPMDTPSLSHLEALVVNASTPKLALLASSPWVKTLRALSFHKVPAQTAQNLLARIVPQCTSLTTLGLVHCHINAAHVPTLVEMFTGLTTLDLSRNVLLDRGIAVLGDAQLPHLTTLHLNANTIGYQGFHDFARALGLNALTDLHANDNPAAPPMVQGILSSGRPELRCHIRHTHDHVAWYPYHGLADILENRGTSDAIHRTALECLESFHTHYTRNFYYSNGELRGHTSPGEAQTARADLTHLTGAVTEAVQRKLQRYTPIELTSEHLRVLNQYEH